MIALVLLFLFHLTIASHSVDNEESLNHNKRAYTEKIIALVICVLVTLMLYGILCLNFCGFSGCVLFCYVPLLAIILGYQFFTAH